MSTRNLDAFLKPSSVALVGASRRPGSVGAIAARNLESFPGEVFLVNRRRSLDARAGVYQEVCQLPTAPELAIVAVPARGVPGVIADLGKLGTRAAIVLSAGFNEGSAGKSGKALEKRMLEAARPSGMRILGPNCIGALAPHCRLNAGFAQRLPSAGRIAFLSQSGAVLTTLVDWAAARGIGFSSLISMGEMADADVADWLDYLAMDAKTGAILLYLESVTNARKFMSAARQAARLKPVIVLKSGRSPGSAKAAASHSGALAGADAVFDAALRRAGALRVPTLMQMLEAAETLAYAQSLRGDGLALLTNGGGVGVLAADQLLAADGRLVELSDTTLEMLNAVLPSTWSHGNPVDIIGDADAKRYRDALEILLRAPEIDAVAAMFCPTGLIEPGAVAQGVAEELRNHPGHKPVLASWLGPVAAEASRNTFGDAHIPNFDTPEALTRGFMHFVSRRRQLDFLNRTVPAFPLRGKNDRTEVRKLIKERLRNGTTWLDEADAKRLLAIAGFTVNETRRAASAKEAEEAARSMKSPFAVKILSPDLLHKSDVGGVALNVESAEEVGRVADSMVRRLHERYPDARLSGVSVQPMVKRADARELIAGLTLDPIFGPVIVFGAGGVAVEAMDDTALALPPLDVKLAQDLIERTRIHKVLAGAGGRLPPVDMESLQTLLIRLSELVCEFPEIVDLDLNPILAGPDGVTVLDARIRLERTRRNAIDRLAIVPYPRELEQPFDLPDGRHCVLRPIRAEDELPMRRAYLKLSPESRYMRLFQTLAELPHELAARATQIDYDREMAFVIAEDKPPGEAELFGGVRLISDANYEKAEYAITLVDDVAGHGVGRRLMNIIIDYARKIGVREISGDVLETNTPMLGLCKELGFKLKHEDQMLIKATLTLPKSRQ
ncbi:MAG TPA: bifunctional acetate--CoA ligase family protein/GNAT family N-acetyltransferase [Gammaproteobacteria bacterium]|nr:bifunctional acetate--CoA ligase family protein/GNAT family N-acetyltransferase [Gammaproteobacteria bacterium]